MPVVREYQLVLGPKVEETAELVERDVSTHKLNLQAMKNPSQLNRPFPHRCEKKVHRRIRNGDRGNYSHAQVIYPPQSLPSQKKPLHKLPLAISPATEIYRPKARKEA